MREHIEFAGIAPLLNDARRFLQLDFELIKQHPHQMYDFAHVWIPEKSLVCERYAAVLGHTPRVLFGLPQSWEPVLHVTLHPSEVTSVAFSPDSSRLASGSDKIVRIWNTATGELEDKLEGHTHRVWSVAFSHNGHFIVSGSGDETVRIWNTTTCETRYILAGHTSDVRSVAISRGDQFVLSASYDKTVRIWDTATGGVLRELKGHVDRVNSVAVSPDCQHIACGSGEKVWVWRKDGVIEHKLECLIDKYNEVYDLAFSHDGLRILCNKYRTIWTTTGHCLSPPDTSEDRHRLGVVHSVAYSPDDGEIVCGLLNGTVKIWKMETDKTRILGRHTALVRSVAFSPDGSRIASGSIDGTVRIWDPRLLGTFDEGVHIRWPRVALSHDGRWIVTTSLGDHKIQVWSVTETMTMTNELVAEKGVESIALSRDGSRVVIVSRHERIQVWNHLTNTIECRIGRLFKFGTCVAFSHDGSHVASVSFKTVQIWDCHTGNEVAIYRHLDEVTCVAFSRDGGRVAFGSNNGTIWIWNPSTGQIHSDLPNEAESEVRRWMHSIAFSYDGNHVIYGWDDRVWIWNVTTNKSIMLSERIQLPDGTRVHSLSKGNFHIYDPIDQETINGIPPYLLSISPDCDWITGEQGEHICWIPPQYRAFSKVHIAKSIVCLPFDSAMIVLDLKSTQAECHESE